MLKIRALNREASSDEELPIIRREAQEEIALEQYNQALRHQAEGNLSEAEKILNALLTENIPQLEAYGGLPASMSTLKYSCYFNVGNVYFKLKDYENALENYLNASELDSTDVTLWHKIGTLALKQNRFRQSCYAFSKGLECSETHWPCLDSLISLLFAIKDTISCLLFIGKAFELDPSYTKGLVLRKRIYRDNPATLEYYKEYNPDHIWEPSLDVEIDETEEIKILEKEQELCDKITEVEKSIGPKALETIPLPRALDDFTWISFGNVVTNLHKYISDNNMSHFTYVDMTKCMSQKPLEPDVQKASPELEKMEVDLEKPPEAVEVPTESSPRPETENNSPPERRPSQNSETNNDNQENTPNQTDNDEDQAMEQETDEQDENNDPKSDKNRSLNKSAKRKRDLVSELQIWGWHSRRKSSKKSKPDRDLTVEDALNRIVPKTLLKSRILTEQSNQIDDSMNTIDIYNMYVQNQTVNILSPIHSPKSVNFEEYFGTDRENDDITRIWSKKREFCDAIVLIRDFVYELSKLWHIKWPKELVVLYIEAYNMYREHFDHPNPFSNDTPFNEMRDEALATLLYGELHTFSCAKDDNRVIHISSLAFLQVFSGWQEEWSDEFVPFFIRVYWLRGHLFRKEGNYDLAINALTLIQEIIQEQNSNSNEKYFLSFPNCFKCGLISDEVVEKILKHLDMIMSLNCLEVLFNAEKYVEVADILKTTFNYIGNHPTSGKMGRPAQLAMLLHSLWYTDLTECFIWTEECLNEAIIHYLHPKTDSDKWEKIVEKCLAFFQEIIKMETVVVVDCLPDDKRIRLVEVLSKIICKQLNCEGSKISLSCITPWILLHYILVRLEHHEQANKKTSHIKPDKTTDLERKPDELPPSVAILFSAHEFLGPKAWCLTNNGELLHFILDSILDRLDTPIFEQLREKIDIHIEQAMFCLYQHPSKKNKISRHLADHNVDPLPLSWERAFQLFDFYGPDCVPEFNSYKNASITGDLEQLFQRIIALVPPEIDPQNHVGEIVDFIQGRCAELPEPIQFSHKVRSIYYLIGDFYFKQREFQRCLKYFHMDLCINPNRVDTWACLGFSYLSQLENKLNYCKKLRNEMEFLDKAKCAQITFERALEIEKDHIMLWIEYGSFEYMVHSFCSRVMKLESDTLSMEKFEYLENQKNTYLESSGHSFEKAIELYQPDEAEPDERWLQYYILGKVAEKQQKEPQEYLKNYLTASKLLHDNDALYPEKINYHNPQHLAVEALELHYRIHASILKYLEMHEGKDIPNAIGNLFKDHLDKSYFPQRNITKQPVVFKPQDNKACEGIITSKKEVDKDIKSCLDELLDKVCDESNMSSDSNNTDKITFDLTDFESSKVKEASVKIETSKKVEEQVKDDVIVLSDSEEEPSPNVVSETKTVNDQELIDKLMSETMKHADPIETDSETNTTVKNVDFVKEPEKVKSKSKNGSEAETEIRTSVDETSSSPTSSSTSSSSSESDSEDDSSSSSETSSSENSNGNMSSSEILALVERCITGLEQCVIRLPQNYKALYRLAHVFHNYKAKKDLNKCKQLLLGEYKCKGDMVITGLFSDRKNQNFFNGIWRIPSSEIDRPGSLSAHMSRCITLLLQVLRATDDNKLLLDFSIQFRKTPDPDKIYIKDSERLQFADQAMEMCIQILRSQIGKVQNMNGNNRQKLLNDIFRSYQRVQKSEPNKESTFAQMLTDVYKKLKHDKLQQLPENVNVLDLATKFCQQNRVIDKPKKQSLNPTSITPLWNSGAATSPSLPSPSSFQAQSTPLKRPSMGRPRGRPPLAKQAAPSPRSGSRGRSPNVGDPYALWQSMGALDPGFYQRAYQDHLLKYSQGLNYSQLSQLSQYFTQSQIASQFAQNQLANQLLAQSNSLISNQSLMNKVASTSQFLSQLGDVAKNLQPNVSGSSSSVGKKVDGGFAGLGAAGICAPSLAKKKAPTVSTSTKSGSGVEFYKIPTSVSGLTKPTTSLPKKDFNLSKDTKAFYQSQANDYFSKDLSKRLQQMRPKDYKKVTTKTTTTSSQYFKEPTSLLKQTYPATATSDNATILMKERPNISITPVMSNPVTFATTSASYITTQTSPGKTLQEKLADKQKQVQNKQMTSRNLEEEILRAASMSGPTGSKKLGLPKLPAALSVSKTPTVPSYKFSSESGISISQVPVNYPTKKIVINKDKLAQHKVTKVMSMNVIKKPLEKKPPPDDDIILID